MDSNLGYFTLDEDSDVEEYVADDPNFKKKVFWYELLEKTIGSTSKTDLIVHAIASLFGVYIQWKLFATFITEGNLGYFGWTLCVMACVGAANLYFNFHRRRMDGGDNATEDRRRFKGLRYIIYFLRHASSFCLLVPVHNLLYYWTEASKNQRDLRRPLVMRSQPQPTMQEIVSVQNVWERVLEKSYVQLVEAYFKFIPFVLVQICILVHHAKSGPDSNQQEFIAYLILWSILEISWTYTEYANSQFNYSKSLQFQDLRETGVPMYLVHISRLNSGFHFLNNWFSALFRMYCIALLFATINYWVIVFVIFIYFCFYSLVQSMPNRSRLRLENLPGGLSNFLTDIASRWMNFFGSVNVRQECFIHFTYVFLLCYFPVRLWFIASEWSTLSLEEQEFNSDNVTNISAKFDYDDFSNLTRFELVDECEDEDLSVPLTVLNSVVPFLVKVIVFITKNCSTQRKILQDDLAVLLLLSIHYCLALSYLVKDKSRMLAESEFPAQIAQKHWAKWLSKEWDFNDIFEVKKILLCMSMSDGDLSSLANKSSWCVCLPNKNLPSSREAILSNLWEKYVAQTNIISVNQERMKQMLERRKKLRNTSSCDEALNRFLEFLWDNFVLEEDTIRMILFALEHFDENIVNSNSLRLTHVQKVLNFKESIWK